MAKFYVCRHCGNLTEMVNASGVVMVCCGEPMTELTANTSDGAVEKHVPVAEIRDGKVCVAVGSTEHPMTDAHYIQWIYLETEHGGQRQDLKPDEAPRAQFALTDDKPVAVYAYCNLHGLWKTEL